MRFEFIANGDVIHDGIKLSPGQVANYLRLAINDPKAFKRANHTPIIRGCLECVHYEIDPFVFPCTAVCMVRTRENWEAKP